MKLKKYKYILILFIVTIVISAVLINRTRYIKFSQEKILTKEIKKYVNKNYSAELFRTDNNLIYGSIYNQTVLSTVLETYGLFTYSLEKKEFKFYKYNLEKRVMDYVINDNKIYLVQLVEKNNEFFWEFMISDNDFSNIEILKKGKIEDPFSYPRILKENESILLASIDDKDKNNQIYSLDIVENRRLTNIKNDSGKKTSQYGNLLYNIGNTYMYNNQIYYTIVDEKNTQYLYSTSINEKNSKVIYTNKDSNKIIYNFKPLKQGIYIQMAIKDDPEKSYFIYLRDNKVRLEKKEDLKTLDIIYNGNIIFHNQKNKFQIFSEESLKLKNYSVKIEKVYPKYLVVNNNIIIQDFDNNFYISQNIEEYI